MNKQIIRWSATVLTGVLALALGGSALARSLDSPTITSISPKSAQPGSTVTINGTNLTGATVTFQKPHSGVQPVTATQAETLINSDGTRILLTIPDGSDAANGLMAPPGVNQLVVATQSGAARTSFEVMPLHQAALKPVITGVMPRTAAPGRTVTITGRRLNGATAVWLAGMKATFKVPSASKILAIVPKHAKSGTWSVRTNVGTTASPSRFTVLAATG